MLNALMATVVVVAKPFSDRGIATAIAGSTWRAVRAVSAPSVVVFGTKATRGGNPLARGIRALHARVVEQPMLRGRQQLKVLKAVVVRNVVDVVDVVAGRNRTVGLFPNDAMQGPRGPKAIAHDYVALASHPAGAVRPSPERHRGISVIAPALVVAFAKATLLYYGRALATLNSARSEYLLLHIGKCSTVFNLPIAPRSAAISA